MTDLPRLDHEILFLHKHSELAECRNDGSEYGLLRAASILRHLMHDDLAQRANDRTKLSLKFHLAPEAPQKGAFSAEGLVFWQRTFSDAETKVSLGEFLDADCLVIGESGPTAERYNIRDVITLCANVLGGVHHEARSHNERKTELAWLYYGGNGMVKMNSDKHTLLIQLGKILDVALAGLEPLARKLAEDRQDWRHDKIVLH